MGCGVSRFHLHDEDDGPLNCKSDELPKTNPRSTHALVRNGDKLENQNHSKEEEVNTKLVGEDKEREINYMVNIEEKSRMHNDEEEEEEDDDDDEEDGRISDVNGWVGSPSFRVYCVDCKSEDGFRSNEDVDDRENKIHADDKIKLSNAVHAPKKERGRRFIKVFPMHIPSGRNFLNVSTCYNPNVSSHTDGPAKSPKKTMVEYE